MLMVITIVALSLTLWGITAYYGQRPDTPAEQMKGLVPSILSSIQAFKEFDEAMQAAQKVLVQVIPDDL